MIDERFSAKGFARLGRDSPHAEVLCRQLSTEVAAAVHRAALDAFCRAVEQLRSLGHDLGPVETGFEGAFNAWEYSSRDLGDNRQADDHKLRLHFNSQVSAGYPHYGAEDELLEEEF